MAFIDDEKSLIGSSPVELFLFSLGPTVWPMNSGTEIISWSGRTWMPRPIRRSSKSMSANALKSKMTLTTTIETDFVQPYFSCSPDGVVGFILYRGQNDDYVPYWRGFVEGVKFKSHIAEIHCSPMTSRLRRSGLMRRYSRHCGVAVYSTRCGLSIAAYTSTGVVDSSSGLTITSTTFGTKADQYFRGGYIETADYSRMIVDHVGNVITLNSAIPNLADGTAFSAYRGCDHTLATCNTLNNYFNFQGQPWIPHKNPFAGDAVA